MFFTINNTSFLLSCIAIFIVAIAAFFLHLKKNYFIFVLLIIAIFFLYFDSRTAFLIVISAIGLQLILNKVKWHYMLFIPFLVLTLIVFKKASTSGRLFILKNTFALIKDNPNGVGINKFAVAYNLQQASYFKHHNINGNLSLLADNVQFVLNEYLQLFVEVGWLLATIVFITNFIIWLILFKKYKKYKSPFLALLLFGLTSILIGSCTYYIMHSWWVCTFYCIIIFSFILYLFSKNLPPVFFIASICLSLFILTFKTIEFKKNHQILKDISLYSFNGYKSIADSLINIFPNKKDLNYKEIKAKHLLRFNYLDSALGFLLKINNDVSLHSNYISIADIYVQKKEFGKAEEYYLQAIYMVPNRFVSRKKICTFYEETNQLNKEKYWLKSIIDLPEKIPNEITKQIKQYAINRLQKIT